MGHLTAGERALRETIDRGNAARRSGRLGDALVLYHQALELAPNDAEASSLYGLMLLHLGKPAEAEPALRMAVEREPEHIGFRINLAELFERQGRVDDALAAFQTVTSQAPAFGRAWERLGDLSLQAQRPADALRNYERAFALEPGHHTLGLKWASTAYRARRFAEARQILARVLKAAPDDPAVFRRYVDLASAQSDWPSVEQLAIAWTRARPGDAEPWEALATAAYEQGRTREATKRYRKLMERSGRDAAHLSVYAQYCLRSSEFDEAEVALAEAEALDPAHVMTLSTKAFLLTYLGRFDEAEAYCRRSLALDPKHVRAYKILNQLKRGRLSDGERASLFQLSRQQSLPVEGRISASFALADCMDARNEFAEAFAAYESANRLGLERARSANTAYDHAKKAASIGEIIARFPAPGLRVTAQAGPSPIFIVGMPRSGTTIVEGVLAAHSRVFACGERGAMPQILLDHMRELRKSGSSRLPMRPSQDWVRAYWQNLPDIGGADHITDKNPFNLEAVGLIVQLFPTAKIVHVRRNPIETGLSIFRNEFLKSVAFANRLEDIGHHYGRYARLFAHWERVLPGKTTTVQYEDFVSDFARAAPALVAACGLEWEEACGGPEKRDRPIATLSTVQARERVGVHEGRARHYEPYLRPLVEALDAAGVDLTTGALLS